MMTGLLMFFPTYLHAQDGTVGDTDIEVFNISGSISNEAHGYMTTRDANRRAPLGNVTTANASFSVLGFDSGINLRYDTDDSEFRQSVNRIGFRGSWRWVSLSAGDVTPSWSQHSLSGTRLRGGQLELTPGLFHMEVAIGRSSRAVDPSDDEALRNVSFNRMLYGARLGYGDTGRSYFKLSGFYAKDDQGSVTIPEEIDEQELFTGRRASPPAENLLISPEFQLSFAGQRVQFGGEGAVSALTRDLRSGTIDAGEAGVPEFLTGVMDVRSSTRVGYAGSVFTQLNLDPVDVTLTYERTQPGFETLGRRSVRDDQQTYSAEVGVALLDRRLQLTNRISRNEDNLLGQRVQTQTGLDYDLDATMDLGQNWSVSGGYGIMRNRTEADDADAEIATNTHTTQNFRLQPSLNVMRGDNSHTFSLSTHYQTMATDLGGAGGGRSTDGYTLNNTLSYSVALFDGLSLNAGLNGVVGDTGGSEMRNVGFNAGLGYSFFDGDLTTNLNGGASRNRVSRPSPNGEAGEDSASWQFNGNGRVSYRITAAGSLDFSVRTTNHAISTGPGSGFSEFESRLSFNYSF